MFFYIQDTIIDIEWKFQTIDTFWEIKNETVLIFL